MPSRKIILEKNNYYHIFNRGYEKKIIFKENADFERFMKTIVRYNKNYTGIKIISYCFLPNHFHIILKSENSGTEISDFMRKISQGYAMYFKSKYAILSPDSIISGPFFEGRFKAKLLLTEDYLYKCIVYVTMNAIKHGIVKNINDYKRTSYHQLNKDIVIKYQSFDLSELEI